MMTKEACKGYAAHALVKMSFDDDKKVSIIGMIGSALNKAFPNTLDEKMKSKEVVTKTAFIAITKICLTNYGFTQEHINIFIYQLNECFKEFSTKSAHLYYSKDNWLTQEADLADDEEEIFDSEEDTISNLVDHYE